MQPFLFILIATIAPLLSSCDPCKHLDCAASNYDGQFRIVSASNGNDLIFGTNRVYDRNQIKFYSLKGTDTIFLEYKAIKFSSTGYDSILHVRFYPQTDVAYIRLNNNVVDIPGDKGTQELKK